MDVFWLWMSGDMVVFNLIWLIIVPLILIHAGIKALFRRMMRLFSPKTPDAQTEKL